MLNNDYGLYLHNSNDNSFIGNVTANNHIDGIYSDPSNSNAFTGNVIANNLLGIFIGDSGGNTVADNDFLNNTEQAEVSGGSGNSFNGNFWSDYTLESGCEDLNSDGICDVPYVFTGGQDSAAMTFPQVGLCTDPEIRLSTGNVYWASLADYNQGMLSVDFQVVSFFDIGDIELEGLINTNGVGTYTPLPMTVSPTAPGEWDLTLEYNVPSGVGSFSTTLYATAQDACGNTYEYPGPYPGT